MLEIVQETIYDFYSKNQKGCPLGNHFNIRVAYELVDDTHPYKVLELSWVGFNAMRTQALFEEEYTTVPLAGSGKYILMIKVNGVWTVHDGAMS